MGGLVGAYYASLGYSVEEMIRIARSIHGGFLLNHAWSQWSRGSKETGGGLAGKVLQPLAGGAFRPLRRGIEALGITAFDLVRRREILFTGEGEDADVTLAEAAIGGSAIPVLFPPKRVCHRDRRYRLIDAGFLDAVPVEAALRPPFGTGKVVVVDLSIRLGLRQYRPGYWRSLRERLADRLVLLRPKVKRFGTILFLRRDIDWILAAGREAVTAEIVKTLKPDFAEPTSTAGPA